MCMPYDHPVVLTVWGRSPKEVVGGGEGTLYLTLNAVHHQNDCSIKMASGDGKLMLQKRAGRMPQGMTQ